MFFSKFVFVWAIDAAFQENMNVSGFIGILAIVACTTIIHRACGSNIRKTRWQKLRTKSLDGRLCSLLYWPQEDQVIQHKCSYICGQSS
jgi:hypothetical protein